LKAIRDRLDLPAPNALLEGVRLPGPTEEALVDKILGAVEEIGAEEAGLTEQRTHVKEALDESEAFAGLDLPFKELDHLSFLSVRIGRVPAPELSSLNAALGDRALVLPIDAEGTIVAAASKKGRFALDTELARAKFKAKELPPDFKGVPPELIAGLKGEMASLEESGRELAERKERLKALYQKPWSALAASYAVAEAIEEVKEGLEASDFVYRLEGWAPKERVASLVEELGRCSGGHTAVRVYVPEELASVREGREKVPVLLKRRPFVSSFEGLVVSYGSPLYGTVDPTPLVAFFFVLLFAIMFGDVGQGAVIILTGLLLSKGGSPKLKKFKGYGPIFTAVGIGSVVMGFLDGSCFANEEWLVPMNRAITGALFGKPMDRLLTLMPSSGSMGKIFAFFGFTIGVGVLINSIGLVINMINKLKLGKKGEALFGKTGLSGALFFWWAIGLGVRVILGGRPFWIDIPGFLIPLIGVFFEEQLARIVEKRPRPAEKEGIFSPIVKGIVGVIESISYYFSNTLSFLRVGAFALSHAVLSFIVFTMGDLMRVRVPGGLAWEILIVIIGNLIILVLEGMIVAIQVVRLQYYEFFSKFFTETGVPFEPFLFEYAKE
jgi:V/A-type H+-transporting ATPase subunit I